MNQILIDTLKQIEREKDIPLKTLVETMEAALVSAYKKNFGSAGNIRVQLDMEHGGFRVFAQKSVVETPTNVHTELDLTEAQRLRPAITVGEIVEVEVTPTDFGRIAAQTAKQVLMQRIREAERESIYEEFSGREGELVTGDVQRVERRNVFVNLGRVESLLPPGEQVHGDAYRFGDRLKVYIVEVRKTTKSPQVIISRSHPKLVVRLFELEVPEIQEGVVEIKNVAREAGARTKIAVGTKDENVDPVGACVGHRGARVQAVVNELNDEKIDIVRWKEDITEFISNALSPAKVARVILNPEVEKNATVIVPEDQQSLAIGKNGQNVRLAAKLTGCRIDIRTQAQYDLAMNPPEVQTTDGQEPGDGEVAVEASSEATLIAEVSGSAEGREPGDDGSEAAEAVTASTQAPDLESPDTEATLFQESDSAAPVAVGAEAGSEEESHRVV